MKKLFLALMVIGAANAQAADMTYSTDGERKLNGSFSGAGIGASGQAQGNDGHYGVNYVPGTVNWGGKYNEDENSFDVSFFQIVGKGNTFKHESDCGSDEYKTSVTHISSEMNSYLNFEVPNSVWFVRVTDLNPENAKDTVSSALESKNTSALREIIPIKFELGDSRRTKRLGKLSRPSLPS